MSSNMKRFKYYKLIEAHIARNGGIAPYDEAKKLYGAANVDGCIKESTNVRERYIKILDESNKLPSRRIRCIMINTWNRQRPSWLDQYKPKDS